VNRHRFADPTFHFDAHPDPDPDPTPNFTHVGKSDFFLLLFQAVLVYTLFYLSRQRHILIGVIISSIFDS
jgi:hypothetical protein